jgi:hypothetical protein
LEGFPGQHHHKVIGICTSSRFFFFIINPMAMFFGQNARQEPVRGLADVQ